MPADQTNTHWVERIASKILASKQPPYIISSGITTSGPTHLGTLCEALYPHALFEFISRTHEAKFFFVADTMDAFDAIPAVLSDHAAALAPHLGKPLCRVPDPLGCCASLGEHFLSDAVRTMALFKIRPTPLRAADLYKEGRYDEYARLFLKKEKETGELIRETSLKPELPKGWSPLMPICQRCGKVATTTLAAYDPKTDTYEYSCDRDVKYAKGCGFSGANKLSDHEYKLVWRLDWPSRQDFLNTAAEGGGVDHMTRGGSWDSAKAVHERIFKKEPPIPFKFGFILFKGKKYSKSKGIGMAVLELAELMPPEVIKYMLLRPDIDENIDIDPAPDNLLRLIDDFSGAAALAANADLATLSRADRKRALAASLSTTKPPWSKPFSDHLLHHQIWADPKKAGAALGDPQGAEYLSPYLEKWVSKNFVPEDYLFSFSPSAPKDDASRLFFSLLKEGMAADEIHNLVFETAKRSGVPAPELFKQLYLCTINKERGPRLGKLIEALGVARVKKAAGF